MWGGADRQGSQEIGSRVETRRRPAFAELGKGGGGSSRIDNFSGVLVCTSFFLSFPLLLGEVGGGLASIVFRPRTMSSPDTIFALFPLPFSQTVIDENARLNTTVRTRKDECLRESLGR